MAWQAFLSYSRQQYYLAESLALQLQAAGISLWFDVQQLEPGTNWQQDIADGLAQSSIVVLLASRDALRSPYVEREWRAALTAGKPVLIARSERTRLPRDLRDAPIIELGGDFDVAARTLASAIAQPTLGRRKRLGTRRLPPGVARMAVALTLRDAQNVLVRLLNTLVILGLILHSSIARYGLIVFKMDSNPFVILTLIAAAIIFVIGRPEALRMPSFLRHQFDYAQISTLRMFSIRSTVWLWLLLLTGWLDLVREFFDPRGITPAPPMLLFAIGVGLALAWLIKPLYRRISPAHTNTDIVRWATIGRVPAAWRTQMLQAQGVPAAPIRALQGSLNLHVIAEAGDQDVLKRMQPIVEQIGGAFVADDQPADMSLIVLNQTTSRRRVLAALHGHQRVLGVITSRCNFPNDLRDLTQLQLIDFTDKDAEALYAALGLLTARSDSDRAGMQRHLDPVNLRRLPPPRNLRTLSVALLALALLCLLLMALYVLDMSQNDGGSILAPSVFGLSGLPLFVVDAELRRGRALFGQPWLVILLACLPLLLIALASFSLPLPTDLQGTTLAIFPLGWLHPLIVAALLTGWVLLSLRDIRHGLARSRDALGMPAIALIPQIGRALAALAVLYGVTLALIES